MAKTTQEKLQEALVSNQRLRNLKAAAAKSMGKPVEDVPLEEKSVEDECESLRSMIRGEIKCSMASHEIQDLIYILCQHVDRVEIAHRVECKGTAKATEDEYTAKATEDE